MTASPLILTTLASLASLAALTPDLAATQPACLSQLAKETPSTASDADLASLREAFQVASFEARPEGMGQRLLNQPGQLLADLDGRNMTVRPFEGTWSWGLELSSFGFDGAMQTTAERAQVKAQGNSVTYNWSANLDEWFINDARGIEHGYTLRTRPSAGDSAGPLTFELDVLGELRPEILSDASGVRFLDPSGACAMTYTGLTVFDATGATFDAQFQSRGDELAVLIDESDAVYPLTIDPMIQQAYIKASNSDAGDFFGVSIAIDGDTAVVGASYEAGSGNTVNAANNNDSLQAGAAYVFVRNGCTWTQQAYLKPSNAGSFDRFGSSVAISGDRIVVGAPTEDSGSAGVNGNGSDNSVGLSGAAYVFFRFGLSWGQEAYLKASNPSANDQFGTSVAISGNLVTVGAPLERSNATGINGNQFDNSLQNAGAAYVFVRSPGFSGTWSQALYLKPSNTDAFDEFGASVAMDGTTIVIGAHQEDSASPGVNGNDADDSVPNSGAAYIFRLKGEIWVQDAYLKAADPDAQDAFGRSVDVSGDTVVVGASLDDSASIGINGDPFNNGTANSGAAYVYTLNGSLWSQSAYLKASNSEVEDLFGRSVAIDGDRLVVGSYLESSAAIGINGDQLNNAMNASGAVYSFVRTNGLWSQEAYLKASNTGTSDFFGHGVAVSGNTVLASSPYEDGGSSGINGNGSDNSKSDSGAMYAFELNSAHGAEQYGSQAGVNYADLSCYTPPLVNHFVTLELSEWNNVGVAALMISAAPANVPMIGGTLLVDPSLAYFGANHVTPVVCLSGSGSYTAYVPPQLAGHTVYIQAAMYDATLPYQFALTNGLSISFCP